MSHLGAKQTLTVYALVLCWSVLVFWAGFSFGTRKPAPDPMGEEILGFSAGKKSRAFPIAPELAFQDPLMESESARPETAAALEVRGSDAHPEAETRTDAAKGGSVFHTVQIGAVRTEAEGRELLGRLGARGHRGRIVPPSNSGGFYRVWVGEFESEAAAHEMEENLKSDGFSTYLRQAPDSLSQ